jgi:hypothetical protein
MGQEGCLLLEVLPSRPSDKGSVEIFVAWLIKFDINSENQNLEDIVLSPVF